MNPTDLPNPEDGDENDANNQNKPWRRPQENATNSADSGPVDATPIADAASGALDAASEVAGGALEAAGGCADGCGSCSLALLILGFFVANTAFALFR